MTALTFEQLFDPAFLARIAPLSLRVQQAQKGGRLADQRTSARGQGSDFADFKRYTPGDDLRAIDWNIYRRLGRTFVRQFEERQDMPVHMLIDLSRSMFMEKSPRIQAAQRIALALAAIALDQHDSVGLYPFSDDISVQARSISGKKNIAQVARMLSGYEAMGGTSLVAGAAHLAGMKLRRGLVIVVSDFFDEAGIDAVLDALSLLPHRLLLVQLTRPSDGEPLLDPAYAGEIRIEDGESDRVIDLSVTPDLVDRYREAYCAFNERLTDYARQTGSGLLQLDVERDPVDQLFSLFGPGALTL